MLSSPLICRLLSPLDASRLKKTMIPNIPFGRVLAFNVEVDKGSKSVAKISLERKDLSIEESLLQINTLLLLEEGPY